MTREVLDSARIRAKSWCIGGGFAVDKPFFPTPSALAVDVLALLSLSHSDYSTLPFDGEALIHPTTLSSYARSRALKCLLELAESNSAYVGRIRYGLHCSPAVWTLHHNHAEGFGGLLRRFAFGAVDSSES